MESGEGLSHSGVDHGAADLDQDLVEDRLVHLPADSFFGLGIGRAQIAGESEGPMQVALKFLPVDLGVGHQGPGLGQLVGDASLLLAEQLKGHGSGQMRLEQGPALVLQDLDALSLLLRQSEGSGVAPLGRLDDVVVEGVGRGLIELDGLVVLLDLVLDVGDRYVRQVTRDVLTMSPDADEVVVDAAMTTLVTAEDHSRSASTANDRALQVVLMMLGTLSGRVLGSELCLHGGEGFNRC